MGLGLEKLQVVLLSGRLVLAAVVHVADGMRILLQVLQLFPHQHVVSIVVVFLLGFA